MSAAFPARVMPAPPLQWPSALVALCARLRVQAICMAIMCWHSQLPHSTGARRALLASPQPPVAHARIYTGCFVPRHIGAHEIPANDIPSGRANGARPELVELEAARWRLTLRRLNEYLPPTQVHLIDRRSCVRKSISGWRGNWPTCGSDEPAYGNHARGRFAFARFKFKLDCSWRAASILCGSGGFHLCVSASCADIE